LSTLADRASLWRLFMLLNPPPPPNPTTTPEKWDPYGLDYVLRKLGVRVEAAP
jgi:hypothetical protein